MEDRLGSGRWLCTEIVAHPRTNKAQHTATLLTKTTTQTATSVNHFLIWLSFIHFTPLITKHCIFLSPSSKAGFLNLYVIYSTLFRAFLQIPHIPLDNKHLFTQSCSSILSMIGWKDVYYPSILIGYWHQRADERHGKPPQGNQELLVAKDKVGRPPGEFGVSKSIGYNIFPSVLWHCWLGDRKGIRPVKKTWCWFVGGNDLTRALHDL